MSMEPDPTRQPPSYSYSEGSPPQGPSDSIPIATTNGFAIASLVLGIVGLTGIPFIPSVLALVFGYRGRREIDRSGGTEHGRGLAVAGIVLGWIGVAVVVLGLLIFAVAIVGLGTFNELGP